MRLVLKLVKAYASFDWSEEKSQNKNADLGGLSGHTHQCINKRDKTKFQAIDSYTRM